MQIDFGTTYNMIQCPSCGSYDTVMELPNVFAVGGPGIETKIEVELPFWCKDCDDVFSLYFIRSNEDDMTAEYKIEITKKEDTGDARKLLEHAEKRLAMKRKP